MHQLSAAASELADGDDRHLARWQAITLFTLLVGYAGYYVCRSNLSVGAKAIGTEFGLDKAAIGHIASRGLLFYAIGKVFAGMACDFVGGRKVFLFGMFASAICTVLFAAGPGLFGAPAAATLFLLAWSANRLVQSPGWGALVKVSSRWFPVHRHGRVMAILCLSYLFGDVAARAFLGQLLSAGLSWRGLFYAAAATLLAIALLTLVLLKPSPTAVGAREPDVNPKNIFGARGEAAHPDSLFDLLQPFLVNPAFWLVCVISIGLTLIRESLSFWIPTYLVETAGMADGTAGTLSAIFPLFGGISALLAGHAADRFAAGSRGKVMVPFLALLIVPLAALCLLPNQSSAIIPLVCFAAASFLLMGPYTFLTGVLSLDFGGKRGTSTAAGLVDGAGYLGAVVALKHAGWAAEHYGWGSVFSAAAVIAGLTAAAAIAYWLLDEARRRGGPLALPKGVTADALADATEVT